MLISRANKKFKVERNELAGNLTLYFDRVFLPNYYLPQSINIHFWVHKDHRQWGYIEDWYDGPLLSFGLGRLILICWNDYIL